MKSHQRIGGVVVGCLAALLTLLPLITSAAAGTINYQYDDAGRLKSSTFVDGTATTTYSLDAAGNRTQTQAVVNNGALAFTSTNYSVGEAAGTLTVSVSRTVTALGTASVSYATSNGTATAGADYTATSGTLNWANGDSANKTFTVTILNDSTYEGNEAFTLTLSNPTAGATIGSPSTATATIFDDDVAADTTPPGVPGTPTFSSVTGTSATVTWSAATDNVGGSGIYGYRYSLNGGAWITLGNLITTANLTGLANLTSYSVAVQARDVAGNWGPSATSSFTTIDTTPPSAPGAITLSNLADTSVIASWNAASDNSGGAVSYEYQLNGGAWVAVGAALSVNVSGLVGNTAYTLAVHAKDAAANISVATSTSFQTLVTWIQITNDLFQVVPAASALYASYIYDIWQSPDVYIGTENGLYKLYGDGATVVYQQCSNGGVGNPCSILTGSFDIRTTISDGYRLPDATTSRVEADAAHYGH